MERRWSRGQNESVEKSHPSAHESLLVFSDVHLGSDLNDCTPRTVQRTVSIDRDLVALLAHYRKEELPRGRWRVVIAGDFIDFIGMSIRSEAELGTALTDEERAHGLGSAEAHSREKLRRVATRHADVFRELAGFVRDGHALTLIHGNHDIELHWDGVKEDLRAILLRHAEELGAVDKLAFLERIEFQPWFFYRDGVAYIEHGHQYDPFCATEHVMAPLSPLDPRRVARGFSDVLLRFVVRPTRGMTEHGHEAFGMAHYVAFGARLGLSGMGRLGMRFVRAIGELFSLRRAHLSAASKLLRTEHERRVAKLATATRGGLERLQALLRLQAIPISHTVSGIMASLLLDRAALACAAVMALAVLGAFALWNPPVLLGVIAVLATWLLVHRHLSGRRKVDPTTTLTERAAQLSHLFPAAFVVMGHTHVPTETPAGDSTYINLGSWAEEEPLPDADPMAVPSPAARTHVVIHVSEDGARAELRTWDGGAALFRGPRGV
jgi:UDP-2,3-diacylglucosamine pyrophosphatase LpxH